MQGPPLLPGRLEDGQAITGGALLIFETAGHTSGRHGDWGGVAAAGVLNSPPTALQWCRACCGLLVFIVKDNSRGSRASAFRRYPGGPWGGRASPVVTSKFVFFFACLLDLYFSLLDAQVGLQKPPKSTSGGLFLATFSLKLFQCPFSSKFSYPHL